MAGAIVLLAAGALLTYSWAVQSPSQMERSQWRCVVGVVSFVAGIIRVLWAAGVI